MEIIAETIKNEWSVLVSAPISFITIALISLSIGWKAKAVLLDERIKVLQTRLGAGSPKEIDSKVVELQNKLTKLEKSIGDIDSYDPVGTVENALNFKF